MRAYVFSHTVMREDVVEALRDRPRILERRRVVDRILERMTDLIRTFDDDLASFD